MNLTKENVCVLIENEAQLKKAIQLLKKYGEHLDKDTGFYTGSLEGYNYLKFYKRTWWTLMYKPGGKQITLSELEQILIKEKGTV